MKKLTLCFPFYENAGMLRVQLDRLKALPDDLKASLELIVVDDGTGAPTQNADGSMNGRPISTAKPAWHEDLHGLRYRLFRILVDVRWNQDAARNLAVHHAEAGDWMLLTDIDHIPSEATMRARSRRNSST